MIDSLKTLYRNNQDRFKEIVDKFPGDDLAGPFLMSPNKEYQEQNVKVLIIGQETNGWGYFSEDIEGAMKLYEDFNLGENYYPSPFWNVTRKVESALSNAELNCAWTNLNKYDVDAGRPHGEYLDSISNLDSLLLEEIGIINPDVVLFLTGPTLDDRVKNIFTGVSFDSVKGFDVRQFARLKHANLPDKSFRTYHPNYLRRSGLESNVIEFLKSVKI